MTNENETRSLTLFAYAKINLYLDVTGLREDGYHSINSVMQTVSLHDRITVKLTPSEFTEIIQTCNRTDIPLDQTNICYKAVQVFFNRTGGNYRVDIDIEKHIPSAAGLAGGSADGAAVIRALNQLCDTHLDCDTLCELALEVGSDLPFCIVGGTCEVGGRGEYVRRIGSFPDYAVLIAKSTCESVSTKSGYAEVDKYLAGPHKAAPDFGSYVKTFDKPSKNTLLSGTYNVFECALLHTLPETAVIIEKLKQTGALCVRMSGSGPSVFAVYNDVQAAYAAKGRLGENVESFVCMPFKSEEII